MAQEFFDDVAPLPAGFVWLRRACPQAVIDLRYAGKDNFAGRALRGYEHGACAATSQAARALRSACAEAARHGLALKVLDAYRPVRAVRDMVEWSRAPEDGRSRARYHPRVPKSELFARGYIALHSEHSRGSALDVTLANADGGDELILGTQPLRDGEADMGTPFDYFDPRSATDFAGLPRHCITNRRWLRALMARHGFRNNAQEWWHFALREEPFPQREFDFVPGTPRPAEAA